MIIAAVVPIAGVRGQAFSGYEEKALPVILQDRAKEAYKRFLVAFYGRAVAPSRGVDAGAVVKVVHKDFSHAIVE